VTSVFRSTRLLDVHAYVQLTTVIWLSHVYRHSATVLVAFAFHVPTSGTHSHKTYEGVTFPGNSSSVDLRHDCLSVLMCRWRVWELFIEDALYKFTFWLIDFDWLPLRKLNYVLFSSLWRIHWCVAFCAVNRLSSWQSVIHHWTDHRQLIALAPGDIDR